MLRKTIIHCIYKKLIYVLLSISLCGCAFIKSDYYSRPVGHLVNNGYLLRGSGWISSEALIYDYSVHDVYQVEDDDLIVAVQINNFRSLYWGLGIWIAPVFPVFGLLKDDYRGKIEDNMEGVKVTVAIFGKKTKRLLIDPCKVTLSKKDEKGIYPFKYIYSFRDINETCMCNSSENKNPGIEVIGKFDDILQFEIFYHSTAYPGDDVSILLPYIICDDQIIQLQEFHFKKGSGIFWCYVL